jgi:acyl carrier protein
MQSGQSGVAQRSGIANLSAATMVAYVKACMLENETELAVMSVDWELLGTRAAKLGPIPAELSTLIRPDARSNQRSASLRAEVLAIPTAARVAHVAQLLSRAIAPILQIDENKLLSGRSLRALGLDSMMALEIRKLVNELFELEAPATLLFEVNSVRELARYVCTELEARSEPVAGTTPPPSSGAQSWLDAKNEDELAAILSELVDANQSRVTAGNGQRAD